MLIIREMRASYTIIYHLRKVVRVIRFSYWSIGVYGFRGEGGDDWKGRRVSRVPLLDVHVSIIRSARDAKYNDNYLFYFTQIFNLSTMRK